VACLARVCDPGCAALTPRSCDSRGTLRRFAADPPDRPDIDPYKPMLALAGLALIGATWLPHLPRPSSA